jgi:hypothetical protein
MKTMNSKVSFFLILIFLIVTPNLSDGATNSSVSNTFFPIGIFSANPASSMMELKAIGFNCVQTYRISTITDLNAYLDAAARNGLRALVYPGMRIDENKQLPEPPTKTLAKLWPQIQNSSAVLAWYLADEPEHTSLSLNDLVTFENGIKSSDSTHLTALTTGPNFYDKFRQIGDVLLVDAYPIPISPVTEVSDTLEKAKRVAGPGKPIWAVIQAYDRGLLEQKVRDLNIGRDTTPTFAEINCMTYLAIVHGAKGIFYYNFNDLAYNIKSHPVVWNAVKSIVAKLNKIYPVLISEDVNIKPDIVSLESGINPKNIHYLFKKSNNAIFLIVVNSNNRTEKITFKNLPFNNNSVMVPLEGKKIVSVQNGSMTDVFKPFEVRIYKSRSN